MRTVGYIRVSTEEQASSSLGLDAQRIKIDAMATLKSDIDLIDVVVDAGFSARSMERPGMRKVQDMVDAGEVDCVVIAKLDRLTRRMLDLCLLVTKFEERGVKLISIEEGLDMTTPVGELVMHIMGAVAHWERREIGKRTSDALKAAQRKGQRLGAVPYGKARAEDGALIDNPRELAAIERMRALKSQGLTLAAIGAQLYSEGIATRRGKAFVPSGIHRVLSAVAGQAS